MSSDGDKPKGDGSQRLLLKGGRWDGIKIRVYPKRGPWNGERFTPIWEDVEFCGELYEFPERQDSKKPYLRHVGKAAVAS